MISTSPKLNETEFDPDPELPFEFLKACANYKVTPVIKVQFNDHANLLIKDETQRMDLGAFKALGAPYAVARLIEEKWMESRTEKFPRHNILSEPVLAIAKDMVFVCASAGNHGLGVAAGAKAFGSSARIYLAETVPASFENRLADMGAQVIRAGKTYDESVGAALEDSENTGAILLADGTWPGYTGIPKYVMEGYTVIAEELRLNFEESGDWPTDVYIQAGVGGLAAAIAIMIRRNWRDQPNVIIVEPDAAPCLKTSAENDSFVRVEGPVSNMGRLDCKVPSLVAWQTLMKCAVKYETVSDSEAEKAVEVLGFHGIRTTPSGAAGLAAVLKSEKTKSKTYRPLVFATECSDS